MSEDTKLKEIVHYKITISPYTMSAAQEIKNYLVAFTRKVIDIERIKEDESDDHHPETEPDFRE